MKTRYILAASISLAGLMLISSLWSDLKSPAIAPESPSIPSLIGGPIGHPGGPVTEYPALSWIEGDHATWEIATTIRLSESSAADAIAGETKLTARMHALVLDVSAAEVTLAATVTVPEYRQEQSRVTIIESLLKDTTAILSLKPDGTIKAIRFPASIPEEDRQVLMLVYGWEFVVRPMASYETIEAVAGDEASAFQSVYQREKDGLVVKSRMISQSNPNATSRQEVIKSRFSGKLGHLWLNSLNGIEETQVFMGNSMLVAPAVSVSLTEVDPEPLPNILTRLSSAQFEQRLKILNDVAPRKSVAAQLRNDTLRKKWGEIALSQAMEPLRKVAGKPMVEVVGPMHDLRDWLSVHPDSLDSVIATLRGVDDAEISAMIVQAMTVGESDTANAALTSIVRDASLHTGAAVIQAVASAGQLGAQANEALIAALSERYSESLQSGKFELADASILSLARIARSNFTVRESIDKTFSPDLAPQTNPEDSAMALMIFENAQIARPEIIGRASELAKEGALEVQTAAISYLGSVPVSTDTDRELIAALKDPNPLVKTAARSALSREGRFRSVPVREALASVSVQSRDE